ncbi:MAG: four-carbon acid sugar kinase family protein [Desulfovibrionaceae bacterium]|nr:four-carbon acid sugar kinase family protein [Desulfovibrionaceae bacterium]
MNVLLGCIADDFTGGTDLADTLVRNGMRTIQTNGMPSTGFVLPETDAVVVSVKCRSIDPGEAVRLCREALVWLRKQGCRQFFWKYCSTFDSTPKGNIGPVAEALLNDLEAPSTLVCPAFPVNKRTVYKGRLFVGDVPLDESSMRLHPITPMTDASLERLLLPQVTGKVGHVFWGTVRQGSEAVREALDELEKQGVRFVVADALEDENLRTLGRACMHAALITGGSGIAIGLPDNFRQQGLLAAEFPAVLVPELAGPAVILSGSCSDATLSQLAALSSNNCFMRQLDPFRLESEEYLADIQSWALERLGSRPIVIHAGAEASVVSTVQEKLGKERSGQLIESALGRCAAILRDAGARHFIVAGGESSGAVVQSLGVTGMRIGSQIAPGVPWTFSLDKTPLSLALKSGNFGGPDFFNAALAMLP